MDWPAGEAPLEKRFVQFRFDDDALTGIVIRYGDVARFGDLSERFERGSLTWQDVSVNIQHTRSRIVARTDAGLDLRDDGRALSASIRLADTVDGRDARAMIDAGLLRGLSVEFRAEQAVWDGNVRVIRSADLVGIGLVDRPAYPDSQIAERAYAMMRKPRRARRRAM